MRHSRPDPGQSYRPVPRPRPRSPHPFYPRQICVTRQIDPPVYRLPDGLPPGTRVRVLTFDHGFWTVEELDPPGRTWRVFVILLESA